MIGGTDWGEFFGRKPKQLLDLPKENQLLYIPEFGTLESRRMNYLEDPQFEGLYDANPYFLDPSSPGERN